MSFARRCLVPVLLLSLVAGGHAQQPNTGGASLTLCGVDGPSYPMAVTLWSGANPVLEFRVSGAPQQPFVLARAPAGIASPGAAGTLGLFDLSLALGLDVLMDGVTFSTGSFLDFLANTGVTGAQVLSFAVPAGLTLDAGAFQALVVNPASPAGLTLTAATDLDISPAGPTAFHVSRSTGSALGTGTPTAPFLTISQGMAASVAAGVPRRPVFVAHTLTGGLYTETFSLFDGVSIIGGLDPATWTPVPGALSRVINAPGGLLSGTGIRKLTTVSNLEIIGGGATSTAPTSFGLRCVDCTSALTFVNCRFDATTSVFGAAGANGTPGAIGANGLPGSGITAGSGGGGITSPHRGGNGGIGSFSNGSGGNHGLPTNQPSPFGVGGSGGFFNGNTDGNNGGTGIDGTVGAHGTPATPGGVVNVSGVWTPGPAGTSGATGVPGGGGGGGGGGAGHDPLIGNTQAGGGGGGGAQGGFGGNGGAAGGNGGASFGTYLHNSSPIFIGCRFKAGPGGPGGTGGDGALGGGGGTGAAGAPGQSGTLLSAGDGGNGGSGGDGGPGGGGPGGAGGPSFCIYRSGSSNPTIVNPTFVPSQGGAGGAGGLSGGSSPTSAPAGATGPSGIIF